MVEKSLPLVNGQLMLETVKAWKYDLVPHDNTEALLLKIDELKEKFAKYNSAGFRAMASRMSDQITGIRNLIHETRKQDRIVEWREQEFFVIKIPQWDGKLTVLEGRNEPLFVPYKIVDEVSYKRAIATHGEYQALFEVPIANFAGNVPMSVVDKVLEHRENFQQFTIMFVAPNTKLSELVKSFPRQDPLLIGRLFDDIGVVLAMWGEDLELIDLALALDNRGDMR